MTDELLFRPEIIAAGLSVVATALAAYATWMGPRSAAKLAERLRRESEAVYEQRRLKLFVFTTLMQDRAMFTSADAVRALNLIDVVFKDATPVREAWAELFLTFDTKNNIPTHVQEERFRHLLRSMAADIGLGDGLRLDDFGRIYYPNALAEEEAVRRLERQAALQRLSAQSSPTANSAAPPTAPSPYPPKPE